MTSAAAPWPAVRRAHLGGLRDGTVYLDSACRGIPSHDTVAAVRRSCAALHAFRGRSATEEAVAQLELLVDARREAAALLGAGEDEIALVESTQHGLNVVADALELGPGDTVVTSELEFLATTVPWSTMRGGGPRLKVVPHLAGRVEAEDVEAAIDASTRAVVLSSVQEVNGFRVDLAAVSEACRRRGVLLLVDAAQHAGAAPLDVGEVAVDAVAAGAHKWLCSPFGTGILYVRGELHRRLAPRVAGYMALAEPAGGWDEHLANADRRPASSYELTRQARRFEAGGTPNHLGALGLAKAIGGLRSIGPARIHERIAELTSTLIEELDAIGVEVLTAREPERRAGIVTFATAPDLDGERTMLERLLDRGVMVSLRAGAGLRGLRAALHCYNDERDVDRLVEAVKGERLILR